MKRKKKIELKNMSWMELEVTSRVYRKLNESLPYTTLKIIRFTIEETRKYIIAKRRKNKNMTKKVILQFPTSFGHVSFPARRKNRGYK